MKTTGPNKVIIKIGSQDQQENIKSSRKTLKILQEAAGDKENLAGRSRITKDIKLAGDGSSQDFKPKQFANKASQTGEGAQITAEDLTSDEPSADYWRTLAEKRGEQLNNSLQENEHLKEQVEALEEENRICKEMLEESKALVEVLQEMIGETDTNTETTESG
ncbi:hypothetical protein ILUMI_02222 [Ignelater luminosus]|uniref:Geminin n=1 Tax=Ignelater luminosus TaxID=2038154 RepID=A0A8K0GGN9_IGNLU|nr:hypothetical protein ILUMI_02222 [Ignelater luminosus]